jgi:hypothetical protein
MPAGRFVSRLARQQADFAGASDENLGYFL